MTGATSESHRPHRAPRFTTHHLAALRAREPAGGGFRSRTSALLSPGRRGTSGASGSTESSACCSDACRLCFPCRLSLSFCSLASSSATCSRDRSSTACNTRQSHRRRRGHGAEAAGAARGGHSAQRPHRLEGLLPLEDADRKKRLSRRSAASTSSGEVMTPPLPPCGPRPRSGGFPQTEHMWERTPHDPVSPPAGTAERRRPPCAESTSAQSAQGPRARPNRQAHCSRQEDPRREPWDT